jgi:predicted acylesterase/phospholipase RssA
MESFDSRELPVLSRSVFLDHNDESGLAAQFLRSAAYSGAEAPLRALAQIADHCAGTHADTAIQKGFKSLGVEPPKPAEFGTSSWVVQQVGGAVGMIAPFMAARAGASWGASKILGEQALAGSLQLGSRGLAQSALREAALAGAAGFVYGSLLTPGRDENVGTASFGAERFRTGLTDMATFATLSAVSPYVGRGLASAASAIESSAVLPSVASKSLGAALRFPLVTGMLSGVPSGIIGAEMSALKEGRILASRQELKESIAGMAVVGGAMSTASWLLEKASAPPKDTFDPAEFGGKSRAEVEELVNQAIKRLIEDTLKRTAKKDSGVPDDGIMEMMEKNAARRYSFVSISEGDKSASEASLFVKHSRGAEKEIPPYNPKYASDPPGPGLDVVLGASGAETTAHIGFLQALEDSHVPIGRLTGVSGGSVVATLYANKFSSAQIKEIMLSDEFRHPSLTMMAKIYHVGDPWNLAPYFMDFKPWLQDFVDKYNLKPQPDLRIVAADAKTHAPMIFEGTNYNLVDALTASTDATPALGIKPIMINGHKAVDGFYYHPTPTDLCKSPSIASKIGFTHNLPHEPLAPWDYFLHFKELAYYEELKGRYPDPPGHIIATTGLPDVAMGTFSISKATTEKLIANGYYETMQRLKQPDALNIISEAQKTASSAR